MRFLIFTGLLLISTAVCAAPISSEDRAKNIVPVDGLRSEEQVREFAVLYAKHRNPSLTSPHVNVIGISRAPSTGGGRFTGEPVWLVEIFNAAVNEIAPMPQELIWIRARDGAVVVIGDTGE